MGRLQDLYVNRMVDYLAKEGDRIVLQALYSKESSNDSMAQADAYGYMVFYNGVIKRKGYAHPAPLNHEPHRGWDKIGVDAGTGREWLDEFMGTWKPKAKGFVLIVVNAAFYSLIQEQGGGTLTKKYNIISQIAGEMKDLQGKFKGSTLSGHNITIG